jgi:hypothetical protein
VTMPDSWSEVSRKLSRGALCAQASERELVLPSE